MKKQMSKEGDYFSDIQIKKRAIYETSAAGVWLQPVTDFEHSQCPDP